MGPRTLTIAIAALLVLGLPATAQALAPVGPGVVGLWQGEGDATDPFNGHDGTFLGGVEFATSSSGQAFSFTKPQQAVDIPDDSSLYPTASFTVGGWARTSDTVNRQALIAHYECGLTCPTNLANSAFGLFVAEGRAEGWMRDADAGGPSEEGGQYLPSSATVADGADHYLAFQRDSAANKLRLYVDGVLDSSATPQDVATGPLENLDSEADDLYLGSFRRCNDVGTPGCDGTLVDQLSGLLDDVVYWDRAVSGEQIAAIYAAGPNGLTTDSTAPASTASGPAAASAGPIALTFTASDPTGPSPRVHDPSQVARIDLYVKGPGDSSPSKAASAPGSSGGSFAYTASAAGTYAFATVATDVAGNVEAMPASPDATTEVAAAPPIPPVSAIPPVLRPKAPDFVTAIFVPPTLYLRLKCPARFKPGCVGTAIAVTDKDEHGAPMSNSTSAKQKSNDWKQIKLIVKPQYEGRVAEMAKHPTDKLLSVRQSIHSREFQHGRRQTVFHTYRVRAASSP